jgi:hypothetical protein
MIVSRRRRAHLILVQVVRPRGGLYELEVGDRVLVGAAGIVRIARPVDAATALRVLVAPAVTEVRLVASLGRKDTHVCASLQRVIRHGSYSDRGGRTSSPARWTRVRQQRVRLRRHHRARRHHRRRWPATGSERGQLRQGRTPRTAHIVVPLAEDLRTSLADIGACTRASAPSHWSSRARHRAYLAGCRLRNAFKVPKVARGNRDGHDKLTRAPVTSDSMLWSPVYLA